jgi:hypothetical protein
MGGAGIASPFLTLALHGGEVNEWHIRFSRWLTFHLQELSYIPSPVWLPLADIHKYHPESWSRKQLFLQKLLYVSTHHHTCRHTYLYRRQWNYSCLPYWKQAVITICEFVCSQQGGVPGDWEWWHHIIRLIISSHQLIWFIKETKSAH